MKSRRRTVALAGATGLVGQALLQGLLADDTVDAVHALGRRPSALTHPKLHWQVVDFAKPLSLPRIDEVYLALGTTIKVAGSQDAFRAVDHDANLAVAKAALAAGARQAGLVSAMGADARSSVFYSRVKGETEDALASLPFDGVVIARPSMLVGDRTQLGQPERRGEKIAESIGRVLGPLVPANYRPIDSVKVANALLRRVPGARGKVVVPSGTMQ
ncbi:NAD(P)H-binding protein [Ramlibacter sp.]|uniref:NAD(P)H-binding protein n=1 Tax=Ramlibacter sp. TaxID=1917967 RepID=UPI003D13D8C7